MTKTFGTITALLLLLRFWPHAKLAERVPLSTAVWSADGELLRVTLASDDQYRLWTPLTQMPPVLVEAFLLKEDRWFYWHPGVNPAALVRAGMSTVRGYRENQLLRDNALIASAEYRIPTGFGTADGNRLQFAVFVDYGNSWNSDLTPASPRSIASCGVGLLWEYARRFQAQLYVAAPTRKFEQATHDLQDSGIHFAMSFAFF